MNPEVNFNEWSRTIQVSLTNPSQFAKYISEFKNIFESISQNKSLCPDFLNTQKEEFYSFLIKITSQLVCSKNLDENDSRIVMSYFETLADFAKFGLQTRNCQIIEYLCKILLAQNLGFFKTSQPKNNFSNFAKYVYEHEIYKEALNIISSNPDDFDLVYKCYLIGITSSTFDPSFDFYRFLNEVSKCLLCLVPNKIPKSEIDNIQMAFKEIHNNLSNLVAEVPDNTFTQTWIKISEQYIKTESFNKIKIAYHIILELLEDSKLSRYAIDYFKDNESIKILSPTKISPTFFTDLSSVLTILFKADVIPVEYLKEVWNCLGLIHSSEINLYYKFISVLIDSFSIKTLNSFVEIILSNFRNDITFIKFLGFINWKICGSKNNTAEALVRIRKFLIDILFSTDQSKEIKSNVSNYLGKNLQFHLSDEEFISILNIFLDHPFTYNTIQSLCIAVSEHKIPDAGIAKTFFTKSILGIKELLSITEIDPPEQMFKFIASLAEKNEMKIEEKDFINFGNICPNSLEYLLNSKIVDFSQLEKYIKSHEISEKLLYRFITHGTDLQDGILTSLPLAKEELLFDLIETKSSAQKILAQILASNDGKQLTDSNVCYYFADKIAQKIQSIIGSNDVLNSDQILKIDNLLQAVIDYLWECEYSFDPDDFNFVRHDISFLTGKIDIEIKWQKDLSYTISPKLSIAALKRKIAEDSKLSLQNIELSNKITSHLLNNRDLISSLGKLPKYILKLESSNKSQPNTFPRSRTVLPSQIIPHTSLMPILIKLLQMNVEQARNVLEILPLQDELCLNIKVIPKTQNFDYSTFLNPNIDQLFIYNLGTIDMYFNPFFRKNFVRTNGFKYLVDHYDNPKTIFYVNKFFESSLLSDMKAEYANDLLAQALKLIKDPSFISDEVTFKSVFNFLKTLPPEKVNITLQHQPFITEIILNSVPQYAIESISEFLSMFSVPISLFTSIPNFENIDFSSHEAFLILFAKCLGKIQDITETPQITTIFKRLIDTVLNQSSAISEGILLLLSELIIRVNTTEEERETLCKSLLNQFFTVDINKEHEIPIENAASKCVQRLPCQYLITHLEQLHREYRKEAFDEFNIDPSQYHSSNSSHTGLINQGVTCFLNSVLQQLFNIPELRQVIIKYKGDDHFLLELKDLFYRLQIFKQKSCSTVNFTKTLTNSNGSLFDISHEQDACEFTQFMLDKLEKLDKDLIRKLFITQIDSKITGITENYESTSTQEFSIIPLPISNIHSSSLEDSFGQFSQTDRIPSYKPDNSDHCIEVNKDIIISNLPQYLLIQLNRFGFDQNRATKNNQSVRFSKDIDISKMMKVKSGISSEYELTGFILHSGTANEGHYISYEKIDNKWFDFNDSSVKEVDEELALKTGYGSSLQNNMSNAYILFYKRKDFSQLQNIEFDNELKQKMNFIISSKRLFCSEAYFSLMCGLTLMTDPFLKIAETYFFDTFPFTHFVNENSKLTSKMKPILRPDHPEFSLLFSSNNDVRDSAVELLSPIASIPGLSEQLLTIICDDKNMIYSINSEQLFQVLLETTISSDTLSQFLPKLESFTMKALSSIKITSFENNGCYTSLLLFLKRFVSKFSPKFINYILSDQFIISTMDSKTRIGVVVQFLKSLPDSNRVFTFVETFSKTSAINCEFFRVFSLIFQFFGTNMFDIIKQGQYTTGRIPITNFDFAMVIAVLVKNLPPSRQVFFQRIDDWFLPFLIDPNINCRITTMYIIAYMCPSKEIWIRITPLPDHKMSKMFGNMELETRDTNLDDIKLAFFFRSYLLSKLPQVISSIKESYEKNNAFSGRDDFIALQYLEVIDRMGKILFKPENENKPELFMYKSEMQNQRETVLQALRQLYTEITSIEDQKPFDMHLKLIVGMIKQLNSSLSDEEILKAWPLNIWKKKTLNMETYSKCFISHLSIFEHLFAQMPLSLEFASDFLQHYAFLQCDFVMEYLSVVNEMSKILCALYPELCTAYIDEHLDEIAKSNFSSLLSFMEYLGIKRPILKYLGLASKKLQFYEISDLVKKAFDWNEMSEDPQLGIQEKDLVVLVDNPDLKDPLLKEMIWNEIRRAKVPAEFLPLKFKGIYIKKNEEELAKTLVVSLTPNKITSDVIDFIVLESSRSVNAFAASYHLLKECAHDRIYNIRFVRQMLNNDIGDNSEIVHEFLEDLLKDKNVDDFMKYLEPMFNYLISRLEMISAILKDPYVENIKDIDFKQVFGSLNLIKKLHVTINPAHQHIEKVKELIELSKDKICTPEMEQLIHILGDFQ